MAAKQKKPRLTTGLYYCGDLVGWIGVLGGQDRCRAFRARRTEVRFL